MSDIVQIVRDGYADFLSGNIPGVLDRFAEEFTFTTPGAPEVPYAGTKRNRDELAAFFRDLNETVNITSFEPREYFANGDRVIAIGRYAGEVRRSGRSFDSGWAMAWTVRDGKVVAFEEFSDPSALKAGFAS